MFFTSVHTHTHLYTIDATTNTGPYSCRMKFIYTNFISSSGLKNSYYYSFKCISLLSVPTTFQIVCLIHVDPVRRVHADAHSHIVVLNRCHGITTCSVTTSYSFLIQELNVFWSRWKQNEPNFVRLGSIVHDASIKIWRNWNGIFVSRK